MEHFSLMKLLREDPDFAGALSAKKQAVKKDKENLLQAAQSYTEKYKEEIEEGTRKQQLMLSEGKEKGLSENEIFQGSKQFLPTVRTPILNFLFFMLRDEEDNTQTVQQLLEQYVKQFKNYDVSEMTQLSMQGIADSLPEGIDDEEVTFEDVINEENTNDPESMDSFIYGKMTNKEFQRIKKLKALSKSANEKESFLAYRKCLELCTKHNLEFDRIPCNLN